MFEKLTKLSIYLDKSGNKKESYYLSEIIKAAGIKDLAKEEYGKMRELWEKDDDVQTAKDDALKEVVLNPDQEALREVAAARARSPRCSTRRLPRPGP